MKQTFVDRTGKGGTLNVADEIERRLASAGKLPVKGKIPRSTLNRLLSAEPFRNRLGFSTVGGKFEFTHDEETALNALARVADDLARREIVLGDLWNVDGKRSYLDQLEHEAVLPNASHAITKSKAGLKTTPAKTAKPKPTSSPRPTERDGLIPNTTYNIAWPGRLQRHHRIWEELQFKLKLVDHPNAISVLFRVLLELAIDNYISQTGLAVNAGDKLAQKAQKIGADLFAKNKIDKKTHDLIKKFPQMDQLISADTLNRYVHSPSFAPSPDHLRAMWDNLAGFVLQCLAV